MRTIVAALVLLVGGGFGITTTVKGQEDAKQTPPAKVMTEKVHEFVEFLTKATMVEGKISMIEPTDHWLALDTGKKDLIVTVEASTPIKINDTTAKMADLKTGDEATVLYKVKEGKNVACAILCTHK